MHEIKIDLTFGKESIKCYKVANKNDNEVTKLIFLNKELFTGENNTYDLTISNGSKVIECIALENTHPATWYTHPDFIAYIFYFFTCYCNIFVQLTFGVAVFLCIRS